MKNYEEVFLPIYGKVVWKDKYIVDIRGREFELEDSTSNTTILFSLPTNDKHEAWTPRNVSKIQDNVLLYWGKFKPKQRVRGYIDGTKFVVIDE